MNDPDGWIKSSYCNNGTCVEVGIGSVEVAVRDSKDPDGSVLAFTLAEWEAFLDGVRSGEFNLT